LHNGEFAWEEGVPVMMEILSAGPYSVDGPNAALACDEGIASIRE